MCQTGCFTNETHKVHIRLTQGFAIFHPFFRSFQLYTVHSFQVSSKPVPCFFEARPIFRQPVFFNGTFIRLILVDGLTSSLFMGKKKAPRWFRTPLWYLRNLYHLLRIAIVLSQLLVHIPLCLRNRQQEPVIGNGIA